MFRHSKKYPSRDSVPLIVEWRNNLVSLLVDRLRDVWNKNFDFCDAGENVRAQLVSPRQLVHARMETKRLQIYLALYGAIYKTA